jgi:mannose-1-phosphate guanylyltransferase
MKLVLLSGGSGKRLWPLSNDSRSKQFLKMLNNNNGQEESMVQRVWGQLDSVGLIGSTIIATSKAQVDMLQSQLGTKAPLVVEPERRDTFPAIALAATYLYSVAGTSLDEVVAVLPVDPYVESVFFEKITELEQILNLSGADLALIGVEPTYPSEKYGYIVPEVSSGETSPFKKVSHFHEKPTECQAGELIKKHALWNCGVFAFKLDYIISLLSEKGLPIQYEALLMQYDQLPKISFDYEVVEKAKNVVVLPYGGYWRDLGTWNTLTEEMSTRLLGKGVISEDSMNTHLINELDIPVAVLGLSNIVVAASPDGILVTDKSASPRVKEIIDFHQRPMYEERLWGWYKVLDYTKYGHGEEVLTRKIGIAAGKNLSYQLHHKRSEIWTIIKGSGEIVINNELREVRSGDVLNIPVGVKHSIKALSDLEFIEVQTGSELIEEDIIRIYMTWDEITEACSSKGVNL